MYIEHFEKEVDKANNKYDTRLAIVKVVSEWSEDEAKDFIREIGRLLDLKNDTQGKWAFPKNQDPCTLLQRFWQRSSDSCPLEATEAEKQESDFEDWVCEQYTQITINDY